MDLEWTLCNHRGVHTLKDFHSAQSGGPATLKRAPVQVDEEEEEGEEE